MPVSEIQVLSLEDTTTWITNWWGLVSCAFFASRHRNCNLRIQKRSALYKWSGAQIQSFLKPLRLILSFFKKEKRMKRWKNMKRVQQKQNNIYIYIYIQVIIRTIEKWSQAPHLFQCSAWLYTLLAHFVQYVGAQGTACAKKVVPLQLLQRLEQCFWLAFGFRPTLVTFDMTPKISASARQSKASQSETCFFLVFFWRGSILWFHCFAVTSLWE